MERGGQRERRRTGSVPHTVSMGNTQLVLLIKYAAETIVEV